MARKTIQMPPLDLNGPDPETPAQRRRRQTQELDTNHLQKEQRRQDREAGLPGKKRLTPSKPRTV